MWSIRHIFDAGMLGWLGLLACLVGKGEEAGPEGTLRKRGQGLEECGLSSDVRSVKYIFSVRIPSFLRTSLMRCCEFLVGPLCLAVWALFILRSYIRCFMYSVFLPSILALI